MSRRWPQKHHRRASSPPAKHAGGEEGFVMVVVIMLIAIGILFGAAALAETLSSRSHANFDTRERRALQAADAGVQAVLYRENELDLGGLNLTGGNGVLGNLADCLVPNLTTGLPANSLIALSIATSGGGGACAIGQKNGANVPFSTTVPVGDHDAYNAEFIPSATTPNSTSGVQFIGGKIISIGVDDNGNSSDTNRYVYQRVEASLAPIDPFKTVEANHDLTFKIPSTAIVGLTAFNGAARAGHQLFFDLQNNLLLSTFVGTNILGPSSNIIGPTSIDVGCQGNTGTNNAYTLLNRNLLSVLFVPAVLGGINVASPQTCSSPYWFTRQPVSVSSSKVDCGATCPSATCAASNVYVASTQDEIYNTCAATTITFAPGDYVLCNFQTNGPVNITATASSAPVRIFIDSAWSSRCSGFVNHNGVTPGNFVATQGVGGLVGGVTGTLAPSQLQVYDVGNGANNGTTVTSSGSLANAFFLYAPQSKVSVSSLLTFTGTVIGYDVTMNTTAYTQSVGLNNYPLTSSLGIFHVSQYTQCTNAVTALSGTVATDVAGC